MFEIISIISNIKVDINDIIHIVISHRWLKRHIGVHSLRHVESAFRLCMKNLGGRS